MKDIAIIVTHKVNKVLLERYFRLRNAFSAYGDVLILLNKEEDDEPQVLHMPEDVNCITFSVDDLNALQYEPLCETIIPGSNHFALLWFYLSLSGYRYYWNIEYDVEFTGNWNLLFETFSTVEADFISTHLQWNKEHPYWYWWDTYQGVTLEIPLDQRIRSFNPIYRISGKALAFLDTFLKAGNSGHHEVLMPTALYHSGFKILDFGSKGEFVLPGYEERFYCISSEKEETAIAGGTMRHLPEFADIASYHLDDKLFHPVKCDVFFSRLKVMALVVTFNGEQLIKECLDSLLASTLAVTVYVVDNASTDRTIEIIKKDYPMVIVAENAENKGFGQGNNDGFRYAKEKGYDYVFLLNQDACVETDTLEQLVRAQNLNPAYGLLSPMHYAGDKENLDSNFFRYVKNGCPDYVMDLMTDKAVKMVYSAPFINAAGWLLTIECIKEVGGFDALFFHTGEDADYYNRVCFHGFHAGVVPQAKIYHFRSNKGKLPHLEDYYFHKYIHLLVHLKNPLVEASFTEVRRNLFLEGLCHLLRGEYADCKEIWRIYRKIRSLIKKKKIPKS